MEYLICKTNDLVGLAVTEPNAKAFTLLKVQGPLPHHIKRIGTYDTEEQAHLAKMIDDGTMTQEIWSAYSKATRQAARSKACLNSKLANYVGCRVEVVDSQGETRRFWVGESTGWKPCHLEIKTKRSLGGDPAYDNYRYVRLIRRGM